MNEIKILIKAFVKESLSNRLAVILNFIVPIIFFIFSNSNFLFNGNDKFKQVYGSEMPYYWTYIIFTTVINLFVFGIISLKESGLFKSLFFIVGSKYKIVISLFITHLLFVFCEILSFDILVSIIFNIYNMKSFLIGLILSLIFTIPVAFCCLSLLFFKIQIKSANIIITMVIFLSFYLNNIKTNIKIIDSLILISPVRYLLTVSHTLLSIFNGNKINLFSVGTIIFITIIYIFIGAISLRVFDIRPITNRT